MCEDANGVSHAMWDRACRGAMAQIFNTKVAEDFDKLDIELSARRLGCGSLSGVLLLGQESANNQLTSWILKIKIAMRPWYD